MTRFSIYMAIVCIGSASILFGLPYVGVTMAGVLVAVMVISGISSYLARPKEIKTLQKNVSEGVSYAIKELNKELEELINEKDDEKREKEIERIQEKLNKLKNNK